MNRAIRTEVYWRADIEGILDALDHANIRPTEDYGGPHMLAYRAGFRAALQSVALAFGVCLDRAEAGNVRQIENTGGNQ